MISIPESLWRHEQLHLPADLAGALRDELTARDLYEDACGPNPSDKELFGGKGEVETVSHFVHRFKTSAARIQFVTLNPNGTLDPHAAELRGCLLDGKVALLDVACGSGGGLLGLLNTLAELRGQARVGLLPLALGVLAADCSREALSIHACMSARVGPRLEEFGIRIRTEYQDWDATNPFSTTSLMDHWFELCPESEVYVVFISAFSGFMAKNTEVVLEAVRDMAKRLHSKPFHIAWIEPMTNDSRKVLPKVWGLLSGLFGLSAKGKDTEPSEEFDFLHPFTSEVIRGRARVLPWGERLTKTPPAFDFDTLAARALNASRTIHKPTYAGLRILLRSLANDKDAFAAFLSTRCQGRKDWRYFSLQIVKDAAQGKPPSYRNCVTGSPLTTLAEAYVLSLMAREPAFAVPPCAYSYHWPAEATAGRNFEYFFEGYERRNRAIAQRLTDCPDSVAVVTDIKSFYPSVQKDRLRAEVGRRCDLVTDGPTRMAIRQFTLGLIDLSSPKTAGIPIGPDLSHVLGHLALTTVDAALQARFGDRYFRYVDDMILVVPRSDVPESLRAVTAALGAEGLVLNGDKQDVIDPATWHREAASISATGGPGGSMPSSTRSSCT